MVADARWKEEFLLISSSFACCLLGEGGALAFLCGVNIMYFTIISKYQRKGDYDTSTLCV